MPTCYDPTPLLANARANRFALTVLEAVDRSLLAFGETVRDALYHHMEKSQQIERGQIPEKLEAFCKALEDLLGEGGKIDEKLIARNLYDSLRLSFQEHRDCTLLDYVNNARKAKGL